VTEAADLRDGERPRRRRHGCRSAGIVFRGCPVTTVALTYCSIAISMRVPSAAVKTTASPTLVATKVPALAVTVSRLLVGPAVPPVERHRRRAVLFRPSYVRPQSTKNASPGR
jgi:hypothetical protein